VYPTALEEHRRVSTDRDITVVLLPGLHGTGRLFEPLASTLSGQVPTQVIAYPPNERLSIAACARFVASQLPKGRIVLLAESFSGLVALTLLAWGTPSIEAVVFCGSFAEPPRRWLLRLALLVPNVGWLIRWTPKFLLRGVCFGAPVSREQLTLLRAAVQEVPSAMLTHRLRLVSTTRFSTETPFEVPCCYLRGRQDHFVPLRAARWFERHFKRFTLEEVEGPHFVLQTNPAACARLITGIVKDIES